MDDDDRWMTRPPPSVHAYPSAEMVRWIELAATYQRAGLGNAITKQTDLALSDMVTFLLQPAQVYTKGE
jgi:hypothetical protein